MSSSADKNDTKQPSTTDKIKSASTAAITVGVHIILGVALCYLKIIFGDLSRDEKLTYKAFTDGATLVSRRTTPSVEYYSREDKKNYVKHVFVENPNFITEYVNTRFTLSGKDQLLKFISLETSYVVLSMVSVLNDVPDWILVLVGAYIFGLFIFCIFMFMWMMLSYYIFNYFFSNGHAFAKIGMGWFAGFIVWLIVMVYLGMFTVPISVVYGIAQVIYMMKTAKVKVLNLMPPLSGDKTNPNSEPYGFSQYLNDMLKTSISVQFLLFYMVYKFLSYFTVYAIGVLAFFVLLVIYYKGPLMTASKAGLNSHLWTDQVDPINIPYSKSYLDDLTKMAKEYLNKLKNSAMDFATKMVGEENVSKGIDLVSNLANKAKEKVSKLANTATEKINAADNVTPTATNTSTPITTATPITTTPTSTTPSSTTTAPAPSETQKLS